MKLVDWDGCGGMRGKVNSKTQVQKPNLGHAPRQFRRWAREAYSPGPPAGSCQLHTHAPFRRLANAPVPPLAQGLATVQLLQ